jgi:hypothetical protein
MSVQDTTACFTSHVPIKATVANASVLVVTGTVYAVFTVITHCQ